MTDLNKILLASQRIFKQIVPTVNFELHENSDGDSFNNLYYLLDSPCNNRNKRKVFFLERSNNISKLNSETKYNRLLFTFKIPIPPTLNSGSRLPNWDKWYLNYLE